MREVRRHDRPKRDDMGPGTNYHTPLWTERNVVQGLRRRRVGEKMVHKRMNDEMRMKNECERGEYDGNIHRWKLLDMPRWFGDDAIEVGQGNTDSPETFLPCAYLAARFVCTQCGVVIWQESMFDIGEGHIMPYRIINGKRVETPSDDEDEWTMNYDSHSS